MVTPKAWLASARLKTERGVQLSQAPKGWCLRFWRLFRPTIRPRGYLLVQLANYYDNDVSLLIQHTLCKIFSHCNYIVGVRKQLYLTIYYKFHCIL